MDICVAGLGLIGGSMCMALKRAGLHVWGWNRSPKITDYALRNGIIDGSARDFAAFDVVFVALPPEATVEFINAHAFKNGAIVADICGVKGWIEEQIHKVPRNFRYVGCHPMAGKEVSTIYNACADLFDNANMIITYCGSTDQSAVDVIFGLTQKMGFARVVECTADTHDKKIAYTSQLAHIVSNAYVKNGELDGCIGFTGGSFQDMTRIAGVDERVWSSLYLKNAANLSDDISALIDSLSELRRAIDGGDKARLEEVLREGRVLFESRRDERALWGDIVVTDLK